MGDHAEINMYFQYFKKSFFKMEFLSCGTGWCVFSTHESQPVTTVLCQLTLREAFGKAQKNGIKQE